MRLEMLWRVHKSRWQENLSDTNCVGKVVLHPVLLLKSSWGNNICVFRRSLKMHVGFRTLGQCMQFYRLYKIPPDCVVVLVEKFSLAWWLVQFFTVCSSYKIPLDCGALKCWVWWHRIKDLVLRPHQFPKMGPDDGDDSDDEVKVKALRASLIII